MPARGLGVRLARGTFGCGDFGQLKPRMIGEQFHEALTDEAGGAENAGAPLSLRARLAAASAVCWRFAMLRVDFLRRCSRSCRTSAGMACLSTLCKDCERRA